ncbi:MAG: HK97 family phage prohead protease [Bacteroidales bacterium]|nr:HK97 family phage prohead protease [Bacteroidales bacterium]
MLERRSTSATTPAPQVQARSGGGAVITGYAAVYFDPANPGTEFELYPKCFERIRPGAFDRAIREDDIRALFNHDPSSPLGRNRSGTLRLSSDSRGLRYEIETPDTILGRDLLTMLRRGDISGSSFAFDVVKEQYRDEPGGIVIRELIELRLFDVGPVTFPAYVAATSGTLNDPARSGRNRLSTSARRDLAIMDITLMLAGVE